LKDYTIQAKEEITMTCRQICSKRGCWKTC